MRIFLWGALYLGKEFHNSRGNFIWPNLLKRHNHIHLYMFDGFSTRVHHYNHTLLNRIIFILVRYLAFFLSMRQILHVLNSFRVVSVSHYFLSSQKLWFPFGMIKRHIGMSLKKIEKTTGNLIAYGRITIQLTSIYQYRAHTVIFIKKKNLFCLFNSVKADNTTTMFP